MPKAYPEATTPWELYPRTAEDLFKNVGTTLLSRRVRETPEAHAYTEFVWMEHNGDVHRSRFGPMASEDAFWQRMVNGEWKGHK